MTTHKLCAIINTQTVCGGKYANKTNAKSKTIKANESGDGGGAQTREIHIKEKKKMSWFSKFIDKCIKVEVKESVEERYERLLAITEKQIEEAIKCATSKTEW